jgi:hypothetical protein
MVSQDSFLVTLVKLVDRLPMPMLSQPRGRGHPKVYSDRLFLKALVIMIVLCWLLLISREKNASYLFNNMVI